jgi:hypothetical protein
MWPYWHNFTDVAEQQFIKRYRNLIKVSHFPVVGQSENQFGREEKDAALEPQDSGVFIFPRPGDTFAPSSVRRLYSLQRRGQAA